MPDTVQPGVSGPALLLTTDKISASHRSRDAYVYVRQSTPTQPANMNCEDARSRWAGRLTRW